MPKIFISPGHNDFTWKSGSKMINANDGLFREFNDFNIHVANKLTALCKRHSNFDVRQLEFDNNKVDKTLTQRIKYINKYGTNKDIVVSLHGNYNDDPSIGGCDLFYASDKGKYLSSLYIKYSKNHPIPYRNRYKCIKNTWTSFGIVLKTKSVVALLCEFGYFSNAYDRKHLKSDKYQTQCAVALYKTICEYYRTEPIIQVDSPDWKKEDVKLLNKTNILDSSTWSEKTDEHARNWTLFNVAADIMRKYILPFEKKIKELDDKIKKIDKNK